MEKLRRVGMTAEIEPITSQIDGLIALARERNATSLTVTAAGGEYDSKVDGTFNDLVQAADEAAAVLKAEIESQLAEARSYEFTSLIALGGISAVIFLLASTLGYRISRSVTERVSRLSGEMQALSHGHLDTQISFVQDPDEIGGMARTLAEFRETSVLAARGKAALDSASASFMIADEQHRIIQLNDAATEMFREAANGIRTELPDFDVDGLIGSPASIFGKDLLDGASSAQRQRLRLGDRTFDLNIAPVLNVDGNRLGTVLEWRDVTQRLAVESEIAGIVHAATEGDFSARLRQSDRSGFMADLSRGIN